MEWESNLLRQTARPEKDPRHRTSVAIRAIPASNTGGNYFFHFMNASILLLLLMNDKGSHRLSNANSATKQRSDDLNPTWQNEMVER